MEAEPQELSTIEAMQTTLALALHAAQGDDAVEAKRLAQRLFQEVPPLELAPFVSRVGMQWLESFRADVPIMTVVIVESSLEEIGEALVASDMVSAQAQLVELLAWHPKTGTPSPLLRLLCLGFMAEPAEPLPADEEPEPEQTPVEAEPVALELTPRVPAVVVDWVERGFETLPYDLGIALGCFERACEQAPHLTAAWVGLGRALTGLQRNGEALSAFEHVLKLAPTESLYWSEYGTVLALAGRSDAALHAFNWSLDQNPAQPRIWQQLVELWRRRGEDERALVAFERFAMLQPENTGAMLGVATFRHRLGHYKEALDLLERLGDVDPRTTWLRASCLLALTRASEALGLFERLPLETPDLWIERGLCLDRLGRGAEARACFERGSEASARRWCHIARHDTANARLYFARAVEGFLALESAGALDHGLRVEQKFARDKLAALDPQRLAALEARP